MIRRSVQSVLGLAGAGAPAGVAAAQPAGPPRAPEIRAAAQEVLSGKYYDLEPMGRLHWDWSWLFGPIFDFFDGIGKAISKLPLPATYLLIGVLTAVSLGLLGHILYSLYRAMGSPRAAFFEESAGVRANPKLLEAEAARLAEQGNHADACRKLYEAALAAVEEKREGHVRVALTNSEYLKTFRTDWVVSNLKVFVDLIDWKWYGNMDFDRDDFQSCRRAYDRMLAHL